MTIYDRSRCGPSILHGANNIKWKNCPMRFDTAFWFIKYDSDLRMTLEVYIHDAYKNHLDKFQRCPDITWLDQNIGSAAGIIRLSPAFTILGREGFAIRKTKYTIKIFALLRNFIIINTKLTDKEDINALIKLWINYRRSEEFAEEKKWREHMTALTLH